MKIVTKDKTITCCSPYDCGYVLGYNGLTLNGSANTPEAKQIKEHINQNYPPDDRIDFFWGAIYGERAAEKEQDARITRACLAKQQ